MDPPRLFCYDDGLSEISLPLGMLLLPDILPQQQEKPPVCQDVVSDGDNSFPYYCQLIECYDEEK